MEPKRPDRASQFGKFEISVKTTRASGGAGKSGLQVACSDIRFPTQYSPFHQSHAHLSLRNHARRSDGCAGAVRSQTKHEGLSVDSAPGIGSEGSAGACRRVCADGFGKDPARACRLSSSPPSRRMFLLPLILWENWKLEWMRFFNRLRYWLKRARIKYWAELSTG